MTRVLAIHLDKTIANPNSGSLTSLARHIEYKKSLEYYAIITKTFAKDSKSAFSPVENMDVMGTNSKTRYSFLLDAYKQACKIIESKNIDVITAQDQCWLGLLGLALKRKYKIPLNVQVHWEFVNNPYFKKECFEYWLWDKVGRFVLPRADTWFVGTSKQKSDMIEYGMPQERVFHVPYTVVTEIFESGNPDAVKPKLRDKGFEDIVLWVGRMVKQKDIGTLLKAAAEVVKHKPKTAFVLLGSGPQSSLVDSITQELNLKDNIVRPGFLTQQECINYYHAADIVCMTSLYEGTCRIFLEAMAASKPIVTTCVAGAYDAVIEDKTGYVVPKRDYNAISKGLLHILDDKDKAKQFGIMGKKLLDENFTMQRHYDGFVNMWNQTKILGLKE